MNSSRRFRLALATAPIQVLSGVSIAAALWAFAEDDSGEWTGLIAVVLGVYLGPPVGLAGMVGVVSRRRGRSVASAVVIAAVAGVAAVGFLTGLLTLNVDPRAALGCVLALSAVAVWILSGRD